MKQLIIVILIFYPLNLIAQDSEKLELSLGGTFLIRVTPDYDYSIGGLAQFGYIMSPLVVFSGSFAYYHFHSESNAYSPEQSRSILNVALNIKRLFSPESSLLKPYLLLQVGFFIPLEREDNNEPVAVLELCGSAGVEFLVSRKTCLFIDFGYCPVIGGGDSPKFIMGRCGVNFHI
jgi:hypothetical protein